MPKTKKKYSALQVKKMKKLSKPIKCTYDTICSLSKLFEKEVEMMNMVHKLIKTYSRKNKIKKS
jgi:hypothetical protein